MRSSVVHATWLILATGCSSTPREAATLPSSTVSATASATPSVSASASAAPAAVPPRFAIDPVKAKRADEDAARCLHDARCPLEDAQRLYAEALDYGSTGSCELFYRGVMVPKDWPRARACFERRFAAVGGCDGSSPGTDRMILASMLLEGQGGPPAPARATTLFAGCYEDVSAGWLKDEIAKRPPGSAPVDFCKDVGGTTLTMNGCGHLDVDESRMQVALARKVLAKRFGEDVLKAEEVMARAFAVYLAADVEAHVYPVQMGTMAPLVALGSESGDHEDYAAYLRAVAETTPLDSAAKAAATKAEAETLKDVLSKAEDPPWRTLIQRSESAFKTFLKAAMAFEKVALGAPGEDDAAARLSTKRVEQLEALLPE